MNGKLWRTRKSCEERIVNDGAAMKCRNLHASESNVMNAKMIFSYPLPKITKITEKSQKTHRKLTENSQKNHRKITEKSQKNHRKITEKSQSLWKVI